HQHLGAFWVPAIAGVELSQPHIMNSRPEQRPHAAAAGVWSKGTEYATNKKTLDDEATTRENAPTDWLREPHTRCGRLSVSTHNLHATNRKPATRQTSPKDPPNGPPPGNDDATHHNNTGQTKPARQNQGTGVHDAQHQKPQMEPHTRFGGLLPQLSAEREPQTRLAQERECMTQDCRDPGRATHLLRRGAAYAAPFAWLSFPSLLVLSEPTPRPATLPNTHTRERQPAHQTESETREVNQPPKRRRRSPVPSTNHATAVQNKYHTPTSVVPHTHYGGRYHTPARVGWSIRTKQGII
ncbi:hypothetical protein BS47DRAFT_1369977, partial [Hydnum rufescens UP504]